MESDMIQTDPRFLDALQRSGLLTATQEAELQELAVALKPEEANQKLARRAIAVGWITPFLPVR